MVALARNPAPEKPRTDAKNRVRDFFPSTGVAPEKPVSKPLIRNRKNGPPVRNRVRRSKWGKDLSGSLGGAGGVGGLLMLTDSGEDYLASYDGNGNLAALTKASDGSLAAAYEYSPYGKLLRAEGPMADRNPFRFSTKYLDTETGLYDYGLRFYNPDQGRFINRDPIEEEGGLNLYSAFGNDPVNNIDVLGMFSARVSYGGESRPFQVSFQITGARYCLLCSAGPTYDPKTPYDYYSEAMAGVAASQIGYRSFLTDTLGTLRAALGAAESLGEFNKALGSAAKKLGVAVEKVQGFLSATLGPLLGWDTVDISASLIFNARKKDSLTIDDYKAILKQQAGEGNEHAEAALDVLNREGVVVVITNILYDDNGNVVEGVRGLASTVYTSELVQENGEWVEKRVFKSARIQIRSGMSEGDALSTLVHETVHLSDFERFDGMIPRKRKEIYPYLVEEEYRLKAGLPSIIGGVRKKIDGVIVIDENKVEEWVLKQEFPLGNDI